MGRKLSFVWDAHNIGHLALHQVSMDEFEEAFSQPMVERLVEHKGEMRVTAYGKTKAGRYLFMA